MVLLCVDLCARTFKPLFDVVSSCPYVSHKKYISLHTVDILTKHSYHRGSTRREGHPLTYNVWALICNN